MLRSGRTRACQCPTVERMWRGVRLLKRPRLAGSLLPMAGGMQRQQVKLARCWFYAITTMAVSQVSQSVSQVLAGALLL